MVLIHVGVKQNFPEYWSGLGPTDTQSETETTFWKSYFRNYFHV